MENIEPILRLASFLGAFAVFALLETLLPDRKRKLTRLNRWTGNFGLMLISGVLAKLLLPIGLSAVAIWAEQRNIGLFNQFQLTFDFFVWMVCFILMDFTIWLQHVATHKIPFLWRFHRVHHTDPDVDVTSAFRFHPIEICLSLGWKALIVIMLGAPAFVVFWFQVTLNASAQFNHTNLKLPLWLDQALRKVIVTPRMHRVHHSVDPKESDTNFGFFLSFWDYLFTTYSPDFADAKHQEIGQKGFQTSQDQRLDRLMVQPLKRNA